MSDPKADVLDGPVSAAGPAHSTDAVPSWMRHNVFRSIPLDEFRRRFGIDVGMGPRGRQERQGYVRLDDMPGGTDSERLAAAILLFEDAVNR